jgi:hypothetical protein
MGETDGDGGHLRPMWVPEVRPRPDACLGWRPDPRQITEPPGVGRSGRRDHPQAAGERDPQGGVSDRASGAVDQDGLLGASDP